MSYLKLVYVVGTLPMAFALLASCLAVTLAVPPTGVVLVPLAAVFLFFLVVPGIIALHLRYDTTWYVITGRSMRIRRGIWILHETTITLENVQNVVVNQGPLQRYFGIADVVVDTAGGGGPAAEAQGAVSHRGLIEGVSNAHEIRDLLLQRLKSSRTAGLGDEVGHGEQRFGPSHLETLREIRDALHLAVSRGRSR